ncbi:hypothetical protein HGP16_30025 [Rhizobium sp. P40RR-XXII]|uniref:hypothetical protein n=1 Tax=Rhizobium sp. P40RR-XXII TaxID=2726739 RepID=UPI00145665E0|nr:hypothetical protein [Rhizobium sp. P40RR-XXII]NLS20748.1 hypothetical protein [Rhizobium sp. P40RR-XXII]
MSDHDPSKWRFRSVGEIKVDTLYDWGVTTIAPHNVAIRIGYAKSQAELDKAHRTGRSPNQIQLSMSPAAAKQFAEQLLRYATALEGSVPPKDRQN